MNKNSSSEIRKRIDFEENTAEIRRYIISLYGPGSLSQYKISNRENFIQARIAFRLKKPIYGTVSFLRGFYRNLKDSFLNR